MTITDLHDPRLTDPIERIFGLDPVEKAIIHEHAKRAWERSIFCFEHLNVPRFHTGGINPYHSVQYGIYLYFLSNEIFSHHQGPDREAAVDLCDKIFMINMQFTGADIYYGMTLPDVFLPAHTTGVVFTPLAEIGNYFMFLQGCNVGLNGRDTRHPVLGTGVIMMENAIIIGDSHVGDHVVFGANSYIKDMDIPDHSLVFGQYPNVIVKEDRNHVAEQILESRFILH